MSEVSPNLIPLTPNPQVVVVICTCDYGWNIAPTTPKDVALTLEVQVDTPVQRQVVVEERLSGTADLPPGYVPPIDDPTLMLQRDWREYYSYKHNMRKYSEKTRFALS